MTQVRAQGSTNYAAIRPNDVLGYQLPLPPLPEQRRIVARIEELAAKINEAQVLRKQSVGKARGIFDSFLNLVFDQGVKIQSWQRRRLPEVAYIARGKFAYRPRNEPRFYGGKYPLSKLVTYLIRTATFVATHRL